MLAWAVAAGLHALLLGSFTTSSEGLPLGGISQSGDDLGGAGEISVVLVPVSQVLVSQPRSGSGDLQPLFAKFDNGLAYVNVSQTHRSDIEKLFQRLEDNRPRVMSTSSVVPDAADSETENDDPSEAGQTGAGGQGKAAGGGGGLWGVVAPCWDSVAKHAAVSVTLDIALDVRGRVTSPPLIVRPPGATVDERRLRAEAAALSALTACMAQGDARFGGRVYRLQFKHAR